jgi:hypothetical protein
MTKSYGKRLVAVAAVAGGATSIALFASGVAAASPDMTGKTFSQAQTALSQAGLTAVAASYIGDKTAQADCTVVSQRDVAGGFPDWATSNTVNGVFIGRSPTQFTGGGFGNNPTQGQVLLTLACYPVGDATAGRATGSGDITTTKAQQQAAAAAANAPATDQANAPANAPANGPVNVPATDQANAPASGPVNAPATDPANTPATDPASAP